MAAHVHTGNIGFWRKYADDSLATDSYFDDAERVRTKVDLDGAKDAPPPNKDTTQERRFPVRALSTQHAAERIEVLNEVPFELDPVEPPLGREALMDIVFAQRDEVKGASSRRAAKARPQHPDKETKVKHVPEFDDSALKKMEAEMAKKFSEKVNKETRNIRMTRQKEQAEHNVVELSRGNELYDKGDYLAALAEYELACAVAALKPYVSLNRGNAFKALDYTAEAAACYQQVLDLAPPAGATASAGSRLLHSYALNNLGAVCEDEGKLEQALQHYSSAIALNPECHLAIKNRADVRMAYANRLKEADALALVPPQNEMGYNDFMASMDRDWHLPTTFRAGGVLVRLEHRVTGAKVEGGPLQVRNESYHVSINHTHVGAAYGYV